MRLVVAGCRGSLRCGVLKLASPTSHIPVRLRNESFQTDTLEVEILEPQARESKPKTRRSKASQLTLFYFIPGRSLRSFVNSAMVNFKIPESALVY